jgi:hypothetical protein
MSWKVIGKSVKGASHVATGNECEDAVKFDVVTGDNGEEVLICCASDGAGSALYAAEASYTVVEEVVKRMAAWLQSGKDVDEAAVYSILEDVYDALVKQAKEVEADLNEFSCTLLGCCIGGDIAVFFQMGDGALVRQYENSYTHIWWPDNGEYQNATSFLVDDPNFGSLKVLVVNEQVDEIAIFTDGLQMLALNYEQQQVHQPFFNALFPSLRMADTEEKIAILNRRLEEYLDSNAINSRTDDDKTLLLATRL